MPIVNAQGAFNVGRDCTLVLIGPFGRVELPNVTGFQCDQVTANVKSDRLDGITLTAELPKGWTGSFEVDRGGAQVDDLFAALESAWYTTGTIGAATIYQYINEVDGSASTYQFTQCSLKLAQGGQWRGDQITKQTVNFEAFRREKV